MPGKFIVGIFSLNFCCGWQKFSSWSETSTIRLSCLTRMRWLGTWG